MSSPDMNSADMSSADTSNIHRYLDEAFAGVTMTSEMQDLKEELRGNLSAKVVELEAKGLNAPAAATAAFKDLGDIGDLIASVAGERASDGSPVVSDSWADATIRNRVRPKPGFVIRTVALSFVIAGSAIFFILGLAGVLGGDSVSLSLLALLGIALPVGIIVADSLRQETTQRYPLPAPRAILYGLASTVLLAGLWAAKVYVFEASGPGYLIAGVILTLGAILGFTALGVTQTNTNKPWVTALQKQTPEDGFTKDPAAAARFGLYTVVIWILAFVLFIVLSVTIGFAWSWLALLGGFVVFFLVLARMLFPVEKV
jgi:ABC-type glycerol-3-phosphate transport system permease component